MVLKLLPLAILAFLQTICSDAKVIELEFERRELVPPDTFEKIKRRGAPSAPLFNAQGDLLYLVNVTVGTPPQALSLQLDTGSSDIWLPSAQSSACALAHRCLEGSYDSASSNSYTLLDQSTFLISYVDGTKIQGDYIGDVFGIGGVTIANMTMGLAKTAQEQDSTSDFQGIVGVGFEEGEAVFAQTGYKYRNMISMLKSTGAIASRAYSLWLNDKENGKGSILFGGIDTDKFTGSLVSLPIQPDSRSGTIISFTVTLDNFQVIDASKNVAYSQKSLALPVILDSGTTITYLPNNIAQDLMAGVGAVVSSTYGPVVACDLQNSPATFNFGFGNPNGPIIVAALSQFVLPFPPDFPTPTFRSNGKPACRWGLQAANGRPNLFGDTFLRGAYVVYNLDNNEVAIANALLNSTTSNIKEFTNSQIPGVTATATGNAAKYTASGLYGPNTLGFGLGGSQITTATGGTFNLGPTSSATSGSSGGNKKSDGVSTPRLPGFGTVAGVATVLMLMGGSLIIFT